MKWSKKGLDEMDKVVRGLTIAGILLIVGLICILIGNIIELIMIIGGLG